MQIVSGPYTPFKIEPRPHPSKSVLNSQCPRLYKNALEKLQGVADKADGCHQARKMEWTVGQAAWFA